MCDDSLCGFPQPHCGREGMVSPAGTDLHTRFKRVCYQVGRSSVTGQWLSDPEDYGVKHGNPK